MLLATTSALAFLAFLNATVLNVALPDLARAFDGDADLVKWTVTGYATALTAAVIAAGRLADAAGRRRILALGMLLPAPCATSCVGMTARQLGGGLGVAVVGVLIGAGGGPDPSTFTAAWLVIRIASAITAVGGAGLLRRGDRRSQAGQREPVTASG